MVRMSVGLAAAAFAVTVPAPGEEAAASCVGPVVVVAGSPERHPTVAVGSQLTVRGRFFLDGCDDTGGGSALGCSSPPPEPVTPMKAIDLRLRQHGREWLVGTADADARLGEVAWSAPAPRGLRPGRATLVADGATTVRVRVTAR